MTKVKVQNLKEGQLFKEFPFSTHFVEVATVLEFESGVMVYLKGEEENPFVSSTFASYPLDAEVEVL